MSIPTHVTRMYAKRGEADDSRLVITNQRSRQIVHVNACDHAFMYTWWL